MRRRKRRRSRRVAARPSRRLRRLTPARWSEGESALHGSTVRVFRSRRGPGPRWARCPRAGRRALVVVRGAAAAGRALRASPRPAPRSRRGRCALGAGSRRLRRCAPQRYRATAADAAACPPAGRVAFTRRSVMLLFPIHILAQ